MSEKKRASAMTISEGSVRICIDVASKEEVASIVRPSIRKRDGKSVASTGFGRLRPAFLRHDAGTEDAEATESALHRAEMHR
jgi:hypothetical protein